MIILTEQELEKVVTLTGGNLSELEKIQEEFAPTIEELKNKLIKKNYSDTSSLEQYTNLCNVIDDMNPNIYETVYLEEVLEYIEDKVDCNEYSERFKDIVYKELILSQFGSLIYT